VGGRDGVVSIATRYWMEGLGIKCRWWCVFPCPFRLVPKPNPPPVKLVLGFFPEGKAARAWCSLPTPYYRRGSEWVGAMPPFPLCVCIGMPNIFGSITYQISLASLNTIRLLIKYKWKTRPFLDVKWQIVKTYLGIDTEKLSTRLEYSSTLLRI
jgi:hypothetical protein